MYLRFTVFLPPLSYSISKRSITPASELGSSTFTIGDEVRTSMAVYRGANPEVGER
jgi:hypothetical protein